MMEEKQIIALRRRTFLAGLVGNIMEWYDFAVYGYFAPIIGRHFFPSNDPNTSLIAAFGVFAAGFLMRPIGGLVFGYIGDKIGRKAALTASVITMAIPTFLIGVLPDYSQIGVTASVLLVILRMAGGMVAEKSATCLYSGVSARMRSTSSAKPICSISSASSSTR